MQVTLESSTGLQRKIRVSVPSTDYEQAVENNLRQLGRRVRLDGFRPGKVPMTVLRQRFGGQARQDALTDLLEKTYPKALDEVSLRPAGQPQIEFEAAGEAGDMVYTASFEVFPEIAPTGLEGMSIEEPQTDIVEADVERVLTQLREQRKSFVDRDGAAEQGDKLVIDFAGTIDGVAFAGGQGEDVEVELGAGRFLEAMEQGLAGMSAGDSATLDVPFPEDYHAEELKGKTAQFAVTVKSVQRAELPAIDDAFCAEYGVEDGGEPALREKLREKLEREREGAIRRYLKKQVMDGILVANPIDLPQAVVHDEIEQMRHQAGERFGQGKMSHEDMHKLFPDEVFEEQARRRTALGLLLGEIVKQRELQPDGAAVEARLQEIAADYADAEAALNYYRGNPEFLRSVEAMVLEDAVVDSILDAATKKAVKLSFEELTSKAAE